MKYRFKFLFITLLYLNKLIFCDFLLFFSSKETILLLSRHIICKFDSFVFKFPWKSVIAFSIPLGVCLCKICPTVTLPILFLIFLLRKPFYFPILTLWNCYFHINKENYLSFQLDRLVDSFFSQYWIVFIDL